MDTAWIMHVETSFPHMGEHFFLRVEQERLDFPSAELVEAYMSYSYPP